MRNQLLGSTVYLAGPIEKSADCTSWREEIEEKLGDSGLGIQAWDPLVKPSWFVDICGSEITAQEQRDDRHILSDTSRVNKITEDGAISYGHFHSESTIKAARHRNETIRKVCLQMVSACDFVICKVGGPTVGTFEELSICSQQNKPVLFLYDAGEELDSCWRDVQFSAPWFNNIDTIMEYLQGVSFNRIEVDRLQWIFMNGGWPDASKITIG